MPKDGTSFGDGFPVSGVVAAACVVGFDPEVMVLL